MNTLKVAIVMGGGVSLGSFGGGALAGALQALGAYARRPETDVGAIEIDVLSGASAGAISLCLLLRKLALPDGEGTDDGFWRRNVELPQREVWVEGVGLRDLVGGDLGSPQGLLSSEPLDDLAERMIAWPEGELPRTVHLGPRVYLLATLMNLNGIPVVSDRLAENPALVDAKAATLYRDLRVFCLDFRKGGGRAARWPGSLHLDREALARARSWREMAQVCLAAGAFPIAFPPRTIRRRREEFGELWPWGGGEGSPARDLLRRNLWFQELEEFPFTYGDGGAFNNEPLKDAMALIRDVDGRDRRGKPFERVLLFIDPHLSGTAQREFLDLHYPTAIRGEEEVERSGIQQLLQQAGPMVSAIVGQASFHDVREADRVNERLAWRDELREILADLVDRAPREDLDGDDGGGFAGRLEEVLARVLAIKGGASMRHGGDARHGVERELARVQREEGEATSPGGVRDRVRRSLFALVDQVAALGDRRAVRVLAVGPLRRDPSGDEPETVPLAGGFLRRFGGFLHEDLRRHDFEWGLRKGREVVREETGHEDPAPEDDGRPVWPEERVWEEARETLVDSVRTRYEALVQDLDGELSVSRWQLLLGSWIGFRRLLHAVFDRKIAPALEAAVRSGREVARGRADPRRGHLRIRIRIEDELGEEGPGYRLEPGRGRAPGPSDWSVRWAGGAEIATWIGYRVEPGPPPSIVPERGPHLRGKAGARALRVSMADDGRVASHLPLSVPLEGNGDGGSAPALAEAFRGRVHLLAGGEIPLVQVRIRLPREADGRPPPAQWSLIPNVSRP